MKKLLILACMATLIGAFAACTDGNNQAPVADPTQAPVATTPADTNNNDAATVEPTGMDLSEHLTVTITRRGAARSVTEENLWEQYIRDRFNTTFTVNDISNADFVSVMNMDFMAGINTDVSTAHRPDFMLNDWIEAGYLRGFTYEETHRYLPNFIDHFADGRWPIVWASNVHSDGLIYRFPSARAQDLNMAWMYREDVLADLGVTEFPDSTEDLFDLLVQIRDHTGMFPIVEADPDSPIWAFAGWLQAFGMPELIARDISMVDPRTGEFIPFAFVTDQYRDALRFLNRLFEEGLMWPEFATGTVEQRNSLMAQGHRHVIWGWPEQIPTELDPLSQTGAPNASWEWSRNMISADPANGHFFKMDPFFAADGTGINARSSDDVVRRFLYINDWMHTYEGLAFNSFGIEGVHYERDAAGNHVFFDFMTTPVATGERTLANYGFVHIGGHHPNRNEFYRPLMVEIEQAFVNRPGYYYHVAPIIQFTAEESSRLVNYQTTLNVERDTYFSRFVMGHIDINDDAVWQGYVDTLNRLGLPTVKEIRTNAFNRTPQP